MSKRLVLTPVGGKFWQLEYEYSRKTKKGTVVVPRGFICDLASVPRFLWSFFPPFGNYTQAAVIHDKLWVCEYDWGQMTLKEIDDIFLDLMLEDGVKPKTAYLMYYAVRVGSILYSLTKFWREKHGRR